MAYTVKTVAEMAGVTVRTLHHYDSIGLFTSASVSPSGYRLYSDADLERLQQILFFRELGFSLRDVKAIIDDPGFDRLEALLTHRRLLVERRERLETLISSVDRTIAAMEGGVKMESKDMFEGFNGPEFKAKMEEYVAEVREKYDKDIVDESFRRTSRYTKEDWAAIQAEEREIRDGIAARMDYGPADPEVQKLVDRRFNMIRDKYYPCTIPMFRGLGEMYVEDRRFAENYEKVKPGLAEFVRAAIRVYCVQYDRVR